MRPNQQNNKNRQRGRGNNNGGRKHLNPLSRNYESNGPDVKVRGNAAHVAEKYLQLARDAQSSGDSVMAENYLQHAEHYFRIVASAQQQQMGNRNEQGAQQNTSDDDDDDFPPINDRFSSPEPVSRPQQQNQGDDRPQGEAPQPAAEPAPAESAATAAEGEEQAGDNADGPRRHRERRRRRPRGGMAEGGSADPSDQPQPDVGNLPAFLTAGKTAAE